MNCWDSGGENVGCWNRGDRLGLYPLSRDATTLACAAETPDQTRSQSCARHSLRIHIVTPYSGNKAQHAQFAI